jgi:magnesium chelatase subunit D
VLVEPTTSLDDAQRALEYLPTGGRTPLAHALALADDYVTGGSVLVLVTDGHANVPIDAGDPWADALGAAAAIRCPALVIDSEDERHPTGRPQAIADAMRGACVRLRARDETSMLQVIQAAGA